MIEPNLHLGELSPVKRLALKPEPITVTNSPPEKFAEAPGLLARTVVASWKKYVITIFCTKNYEITKDEILPSHFFLCY